MRYRYIYSNHLKDLPPVTRVTQFLSTGDGETSLVGIPRIELPTTTVAVGVHANTPRWPPHVHQHKEKHMKHCRGCDVSYIMTHCMCTHARTHARTRTRTRTRTHTRARAHTHTYTHTHTHILFASFHKVCYFSVTGNYHGY